MTTCLWFTSSTAAQEAAQTYTRIFPNSAITNTSHYGGLGGGTNTHGHAAGDILTIFFSLNGHSFTILNGGEHAGMHHTGAVSFIIECDDQAEVDHYYDSLGEGGPEEKKRCGWVTDKWGVVWQVVPKQLMRYMKDEDKVKAGRVAAAMMKMKKMDIEGLRKAYESVEEEG